MCGIAGLLIKKSITEERRKSFIVASDVMAHRGPDHKGVFESKHLMLIHHRLSIIDLGERAHQPFTSASGRFLSSYNGEIYNFNDLKVRYDIHCKTTSDTEVMLESFERFGPKVISEWNGIFAMALFDQKNNKLHLVRDRLGVKPLYVYEDEEVMAFASEAKVILQWLPAFSINTLGLSQYMWYGNTTGAQTIVNGLIKLPPATHVVYDVQSGSKDSQQQYWSIKAIAPAKLSESEAVAVLRAKLEKAVERQLVADVPVGVLLSGGIDSSSIVAFASRHASSKLDSYTVAYDYNIGGKSELDTAARIARQFGTNHHELFVKSDDVKEVFSELVYQYDEPFADAANIPLFQLARACGKDKRVILQGDGGDELFAGYRRYNVLDAYYFWKYASLFYPLIPHARWKERMRRMRFVLSQSHDGQLMAYYLTQDVPYKPPLQVFSDEWRTALSQQDWQRDYAKAAATFSGCDRIQKLLFTDISILLPNTYLEKVDKATMKCSIEARVPYLDNELTEFALSLPASMKVQRGQKKYLLKKALSGLIPDEILYGTKRGFDVPYKQWLKIDLFDFAAEAFQRADDRILDRQVCLELLKMHRAGKGDFGPLLWKTLVLCHWLECYRDKLSS